MLPGWRDPLSDLQGQELAGLNILGTRRKRIPFPPREDKATKWKVGKALRDSQRPLKGLREVPVPKLFFPLSASEETTIVTNLSHCVCLSIHLVGSDLRYSVMVFPDRESAAYTTKNVQDGIRSALPEIIDDTWHDPTASSGADDGEDKDQWDGRADVPMDLQRLAWASCETGASEAEKDRAQTHRWAHMKLPTTKQRSKKKFYCIALGGIFPWSSGKVYPTWVDCYWHTQGATVVKFTSFNSWTECIRWYKEVTGARSNPVFVPKGEDLFAPAHIWEACLSQEESSWSTKRTKADFVDLTDTLAADESMVHQEEAAPVAINTTAAAAKRPRDMEDDDTAAMEQATRQVTIAESAAPEYNIQPSNAPTPAVWVSNLTPGVTVRCLMDVFSKYGELVGIHPIRDGSTIVQYQTVEVAQDMWDENDGRRIINSIMEETFVHLSAPSVGVAPMEDGDATDASTISTKDGALTPRLPPAESQQDDSIGLDPREQTNGMEAAPRRPDAAADDTRAAIDIARSHCPPEKRLCFKEMVADGVPC